MSLIQLESVQSESLDIMAGSVEAKQVQLTLNSQLDLAK
jgi:hypothetical protein